jgi:hypothetical protein
MFSKDVKEPVPETGKSEVTREPDVVLVNLTTGTVVKEPKPPGLIGKPKLLLSKALRLSKSGGRKVGKETHFDVSLYQNGSTSSSVSSALAVNVTLNAYNASEYSSFAGLFDDYKIRKVDVHFSVQGTAGATLGTPVWGALSYDATYNAAPVSVVGSMEADQKYLFSMGGNLPSWPVSAVKNGIAKFGIKIPAEPVLVNLAGSAWSNAAPGAWMSFADTTDSNGNLKIYIDPISGAYTYIRYIIVYHITCRQRT